MEQGAWGKIKNTLHDAHCLFSGRKKSFWRKPESSYGILLRHPGWQTAKKALNSGSVTLDSDPGPK
jgi:hypothetical protein